MVGGADRNFIGEKIVRRVTMHEGVDVEISKNMKDELQLTGISLENVSQSAADIQQICRVRNKDIRKVCHSCFFLKKILTLQLRYPNSFADNIDLRGTFAVLGRSIRFPEREHRRRLGHPNIHSLSFFSSLSFFFSNENQSLEARFGFLPPVILLFPVPLLDMLSTRNRGLWTSEDQHRRHTVLSNFGKTPVLQRCDL